LSIRGYSVLRASVGVAMDAVYERCCGLDIHKRTVVACIIVPGSRKQVHKEIRTFGTMTDDLLALADWLATEDVTHVAMESTGVFWKPVFNLLEQRFELLLVNARDIKQVPGRKTDVKDCEWIADLLRHGLLKASFVPDRPQRELRELVRYRTTLVRERSAEVNRLQKTLEGANIKLASVASDPLGLSGRQMLDALVGGSTDTVAMAELARGKMRAKRGLLERALAGRMAAHQRFLLTEQLCHIDALDDSIARVSAEIAERMRPFAEALERLDTIPGVGPRMSEILIAEIGVDMRRFPSAAHLASWAGMCPGNQESAGKRKSGKTRKGNVWLRAALIEAAHALGRGRGTYLAAQYRRLTARRGKKKAAVALGHAILVIVYHVLKRAEVYQDLGVHYFDESRRERVERGLVQRLKNLGYKVTLEPAQPDTSAA
jgi:transposase